MKKKSKIMKILSFFMVCVMALSMMTVNVQAEAEPTPQAELTGSLTLQNVINEENPKETSSKYAIYQIFVSEETESTGVFEYTWAKNFKNFENKEETTYGMTMEAIKALSSGPDDFRFDSKSVDQLTPLLEKYINENKISPISEVAIGDKAAGLDYGYYLILETETPEGYKKSKPMLVEIPKNGNPDVTITVKEQVLTIEKKIIDDNELVDTDAPQVGDEITFQVTYDVPKYADEKNVTFYITDTLGKGLTFVGKETVKVYKDEINENNLLSSDKYGITFKKDEQTEKTTVTFDFSNLEENKNYYTHVKDANKLIIQYKATLNEDAEFGPGSSDTNVNTVVPTYGKDGDIVTGKDDKTKAYSGALEIIKKDADGGKDTLLPGAEFKVYEADAEGNIDESQPAKLVTYEYDEKGDVVSKKIKDAVSTTGKDGKIRFDGLGEGTYFIKETKSPGGYILLKKPIKVEVKINTPDEIVSGNEKATFTYTVTMEQDKDKVIEKNEDGLLTLTVKNEKGFSLPTTGGMGTYLFTIGGIILMAAAAVLLIRSRKKA